MKIIVYGGVSDGICEAATMIMKERHSFHSCWVIPSRDEHVMKQFLTVEGDAVASVHAGSVESVQAMFPLCDLAEVSFVSMTAREAHPERRRQ